MTKKEKEELSRSLKHLDDYLCNLLKSYLPVKAIHMTVANAISNAIQHIIQDFCGKE